MKRQKQIMHISLVLNSREYENNYCQPKQKMKRKMHKKVFKRIKDSKWGTSCKSM